MVKKYGFAILEEDDETTILSSAITGTISGNKNLKVGFERTYTANLVDEDGNVVEWSDDFSWNMISFFDVDFKTDGNKIRVLVENDDFVDEKFKIQVVYGEAPIGEMVINIVGMI